MNGTCAYGDENDVTLVEAGEVITIPAGVWHWHGATPQASMMHISIRKMGNSTNWDVKAGVWQTQYERLAEQGR